MAIIKMPIVWPVRYHADQEFPLAPEFSSEKGSTSLTTTGIARSLFAIGRYASGARSIGEARFLMLTQFRRRPMLSDYCLPLVVGFRFVLAAARSHFAPSSVAAAAAIHKKPATLLGRAPLYALDIFGRQ
jgi:hypothetical protein